MRWERFLWVVAGALGGVAPALAQAPASVRSFADSVEIARAVARSVAGQGEHDSHPSFVLTQGSRLGSSTRFDSLLVREMSALPAFRGPIRDLERVVEVQTRGLVTSPYPQEEIAGLPAVVVVTYTCYVPSEPDYPGGGDWIWDLWQSHALVRRSEQGWEVAAVRSFDAAHGSCPPRGRRPRRSKKDPR